MLEKFNQTVSSAKMKIVPAICGAGTMALLSVPSFAAGEPADGVAVTTDMLSPILDSIKANIGVILPVGIAIFGIIIGISLIPKIFHKFMG